MNKDLIKTKLVNLSRRIDDMAFMFIKMNEKEKSRKDVDALRYLLTAFLTHRDIKDTLKKLLANFKLDFI